MSETERFDIVRSLGRDSGAFVARDREARGRLVILERVKRATLSPENAEALVRRTRLLAASSHPCIERIHEPIESDDTITLVSEFIDGEWLSALKDAKPRPSLEVLLRILLDAMRGLAAMLELTDADGKPAPIVHGALSPEAVLVTPQGTTIVTRFARGVPRLADVRSDAAYIPFEVLRGRRPPDERTDVYSVGAMLWESLTGERPLAGMSLSEIIETATETRVPPARVPSSAPWAEPLAEIAWRALALDPEERQRDLIAVAAEVRRIAGARVADPLAVEDFMKNVGAFVRVRERRASLERGDEEEAAPISSGQLLSESDIQVVPVPPIPSQRPKPTPPPLRVSAPPRDAPPAEAVLEAALTPQASPSPAPAPAPSPLAAPEPVRPRLTSDPPRDLPSTERASLEDVWATPPKLPTNKPPSADIPIAEALDTGPPKVIIEVPAAEASESPDPEKEREAWERRQPTLAPKNRPGRVAARAADAPPPKARSGNRWGTVALLAVAVGFGWLLGRRSAESESSLASTAHAGDLVPSASCACPSSAEGATTVAALVTLSPVTRPAGSSTGPGISTPVSTPVSTTPVTMQATTQVPAPPLTSPPPSAVKHPLGPLPPKTVVTLEPNPSPPHSSAAPAPPATAPPPPKAFVPDEP